MYSVILQKKLSYVDIFHSQAEFLFLYILFIIQADLDGIADFFIRL